MLKQSIHRRQWANLATNMIIPHICRLIYCRYINAEYILLSYKNCMNTDNPNILEEKRLVEIGSYIKQLRKTKTILSAEDFANEKGFDRVQYSRIEKGTNITMKTLFKVIDAHNMSLNEFFSSFK